MIFGGVFAYAQGCICDPLLSSLVKEVDQQIVIYTKGCVPQFEKWLQDNLTIVAGIFIGIALLQIFGICLAQNLVSDIEAVRASW